MEKFNVLIPARLASSRLPEKPLKQIYGKPLIYWTWQQCMKSNAENVLILTDSKKVMSVCEGFGADVALTSASANSGLERIAEYLQKNNIKDESIWANVQGDEPLIHPEIINQVASLLMNNSYGMATLYEDIDCIYDIFDPNIVKVLTNKNGEATYFSRAPIPFYRDGFHYDMKTLPKNWKYQRHIGVYAYKTSFIHRYSSWEKSNLEDIEKLEQLRVLWEGEKIRIEKSLQSSGIGVDTQGDLDKVIEIFKNNNGHPID